MIASLPFIDSVSFRGAGPRATEAPAPGRGSSSLPDPGEGHFPVLAADGLRTGRAERRDARLGLRPAADFTGEGDLVAVPAFDRAAANRFSACACVAGREGGSVDALPPPHGFLDMAAERLRASGDRRRAERRDARKDLRPAAAGPP